MLSWLAALAFVFTIIYFIDRAWKGCAIWTFFRRASPPEPEKWPSLSLVQPVTASPNDLRTVLTIRAQSPYSGDLQQIIVCDEQDAATMALVRELLAEFPEWKPEMALVQSSSGVAIKTAKQLAGLRLAAGQVLCFIDDDILLRRDTLETLVRHLQPGVGATFGLACYTNWRTVWGGLMSSFVNANALLNYIPLTFLTDPYTVTGHIYALMRADFDAVGGLNGMENRLDDDHELARRVMRAGLVNRQTPAIYDVDNELPTLQAYLDQMKRWFVFPRQCMLPGIRPKLRYLTIATSLANILPGLVLILAFNGISASLALAACLVIFYAVTFWGERRYLKSPSPGWAWLLYLLVALCVPFQILFLLLSDNTIRWRGRQMSVKRDGEYEVKGQR